MHMVQMVWIECIIAKGGQLLTARVSYIPHSIFFFMTMPLAMLLLGLYFFVIDTVKEIFPSLDLG